MNKKRVMSVTIGPADGQITLFPNGSKFSATDVFLGEILLHEIMLSGDANAALESLVNVYEGVVAATNLPRIGGTASHSPADLWRLIASAATVAETAQREPYTLVAPNAEVTNLRKITTGAGVEVIGDQATGLHMSVVLPFGSAHLKGAAIHVTNGRSTGMTVQVVYTPLASGWSRRRRFYRKGATGVSTATGATSLTDAGATWRVNEWVGYRIQSASSTGTIVSNTETVATIGAWTGGTPAAPNAYAIFLHPKGALAAL